VKLKRTTLALLFSILFLLFSCEEDDSSKYSFKIIATGDDFTGYYSVDGGDENYFGTSDTEDNSPYYYYSRELDNPGYVRIHADGTSTDTTYIAIEVYYDGELVETSEVSQSDETETISVTCTYDFDSES